MWARSSYCVDNSCIEVEFKKSTKSALEVAQVEDAIYIRNSEDPDGLVLKFTQGEWDAFLKGAKDGEFDA